MNLVGGLVLAVVAVMLVFQGYVYWQSRRIRGASVARLDPAATDLIEGRSDALVYFFSPRCAPCRKMTPVLMDLAKSNPAVKLVDISQDPHTAVAFSVRATPTLVRVRNGVVDNVILGACRPVTIKELAP